MEKLIEKLIAHIDAQMKRLSDADYIEVLEEVSSVLDMKVDAKRQEISKEDKSTKQIEPYI